MQSILYRMGKHKVLLHSTGNYIQYSVINHNGKEYEKECMCACLYIVTQSCSTLCNPVDCSPPDSSVNEIFPGKNTGVGCDFLLQGISPTQILNPCFPHCRQILYHLSHQGSLLFCVWYLSITASSEAASPSPSPIVLALMGFGKCSFFDLSA